MKKNSTIVYSIHNGVEIQVQPQFRADLSGRSHMNSFEYMIRIKNLNPYRIKLLSRYWEIFDGNLTRRIIEGEGVVGEQPELEENQFHQYTSFANISAALGNMSGHYEFVILESGKKFKVDIPQFDFFHPSLFN